MADSHAPIFIAGTGRSGTTLLRKLLSRHPDLYGVPIESKFIVEGDGLSDLVWHLTEHYSVTGSDLAFDRFVQLMRAQLPGGEGILPGQPGLAECLGVESYVARLDAFIEALVDYRVDGHPASRMFVEREELLAIVRSFIAGLFGDAAAKQGKRRWAEKTPTNLVALDFLWELFPDATVVHVKRDPRGVFDSLRQQPWGPREPLPTVLMLWKIYARWRRLKASYDFSGRRYVELKLEDLVAQPQAELGRIAATAGLAPWNWDCRGVNDVMANRWRQVMPDDLRALCEQRLADAFPLMGYSI